MGSSLRSQAVDWLASRGLLAPATVPPCPLSSFGRFFYRFPHGESGADVHQRMTIFQVGLGLGRWGGVGWGLGYAGLRDAVYQCMMPTRLGQRGVEQGGSRAGVKRARGGRQRVAFDKGAPLDTPPLPSRRSLHGGRTTWCETWMRGALATAAPCCWSPTASPHASSSCAGSTGPWSRRVGGQGGAGQAWRVAVVAACCCWRMVLGTERVQPQAPPSNHAPLYFLPLLKTQFLAVWNPGELRWAGGSAGRQVDAYGGGHTLNPTPKPPTPLQRMRSPSSWSASPRR